jgi:hypothetical protein
MKMNTPIPEIAAHRHHILPNSQDYEVVRCVYDFDSEHDQKCVILTLVNRYTRERRCLRFSGVECDHPLKDSLGIYILDANYRQWERFHVEVGEIFEEGGVHFLAESVEQIEC